MKHLDIKFHFAREKILNGVMQLKYVSSNEQIDILTKPLSKFVFEKHRSFMLK